MAGSWPHGPSAHCVLITRAAAHTNSRTMTDLRGDYLEDAAFAQDAMDASASFEDVGSQGETLLAQGPQNGSASPVGATNKDNQQQPQKRSVAPVKNTGATNKDQPGRTKPQSTTPPQKPKPIGPSRQQLEQGAQKFKENPAFDPVRAVVGGVLSGAEEGAEFIKKVDDTIKGSRNQGAQQMPQEVKELFPTLTSPLNPKDDIFSNKYEAAQYDLGSSALGARTGVGKVAEGFIGIGTLLWATGGLGGQSATGGAIGALKSGQGMAGAAKAVGASGALRGIFADLIYRPEQGNISNLFRDYAPEWGPAWFQSLTADLAVKDDDLPWMKMFKTSLEGAGVSEIADVTIGIIKAVRHARRLALPEDAAVDAAIDNAFQNLRELDVSNPRPKTWGEVATRPENARYFSLGPAELDGGVQVPPEQIKQATEQLWEGKVEGFSIHPQTGQPPTSGYMVAIDASTPLKAPTDEAIQEFILDNEEALLRPDAFLGGWLDDSGKPVVEIARNVQDMQEAIRLGKEFDQVSIYEVATGNFIETGGIDQLKLSRNIGFSDVNQRAVLNRGLENTGGKLFPVAEPEPVNAQIIYNQMNQMSVREQSRFMQKLDEIQKLHDISVQEVRRIAPPAIDKFGDTIPRGIATDQQFKMFPGDIPAQDFMRAVGKAQDDAWGGDRLLPRDIAGLFRSNEDVISVYQALYRQTDETLGTAYHESFHRLQRYYLRKEDYEVLQTTFGALKAKFGSFTGADDVSLHELQAESFRWYAQARHKGLQPAEVIIQNFIKTFGDSNQISKFWSGVISKIAVPFDNLLDTIERGFNFFNGRGWRAIKDVYEDAFSGALAQKGKISSEEEFARMGEWFFNNDVHLKKVRPPANPDIGKIEDAAVQQTISDDFSFLQVGRGNDPILTPAAHRLIAATPNADEIITNIAKTDPDLAAIAARAGKSVDQIRQEAADLIRDFNGDVGSLPTFTDEYGAPVLTSPAMVAVKTMIADTANQISASAYALLKTIESGADPIPQTQPLIDQLKTLLKSHKFTTYHYGFGLKRLDIPGLHVQIDNPFYGASIDDITKGIRESEEFLDQLAEQLASGNPEAVKKALGIANALVLAQGDPHLIKTIGYWANEVGWDTFLHVFYNALLSGPKTQIVNNAFNLFNTLYRPLTASVGSFFTKDGHMVREEAAASFTAFHQSIAEGLRFARMSFNMNMPINDGGKGMIHNTKLDTELDLLSRVAAQSNDIPLKLGVNLLKLYKAAFANPVFTLPSRLLTTEDEFFKAMVARMEWNRLSWREAALAARESGEPVKAVFENVLKKNADEWFILDGPNKGAIKSSKLLDTAKNLTLQTELEGSARAFGEWVHSMPHLRIFFPFVKTGHNLNVFAATHIPPLAPLLKEYKEVMAKGDHYEVAAMKGRQALGAILVGYAAMQAYWGNITGGGPTDPGERKTWLENNSRRAIKLGNGAWMSYQRIEPFNIILGIVSDTVYHWKTGRLTDADTAELLGIASFIIGSNITERSVYAGLAPLGRLMTPGDQSVYTLERIGLEAINNMIPLSMLRKDIAQALQPYEQIYRDELQRALWRAYGENTGIAIKYDWLTGEPVEAPLGGLGAVWPYRVKERTKDPVRDELEDIRFEAHDVVRSRNVELTPAQQSEVQKFLGTRSGVYKELNKLFKSSYYKNLKKQYEQQKAEGLEIGKRDRAYYREVERVVSQGINLALQTLYWEDNSFRQEAGRITNDLHKARMLDPKSNGTTSMEELSNYLQTLEQGNGK